MMAWKGKRQPKKLQKGGWLRNELIRRAGGRCEALLSDTGQRCFQTGTDADHIVPGFDHRIENLQWLCSYHHNMKTRGEQREGAERARAAGYTPWGRDVVRRDETGMERWAVDDDDDWGFAST